MADTRNNLVKILAEKDRVKGFLANLEKLKTDDAIKEEQYKATKEEYDHRLTALSLETSKLKDILRKELETFQVNLEILQLDMGRLEAKYKVGEIALADYRNNESKLRAKTDRLKKETTELTKFIGAQISGDLISLGNKVSVGQHTEDAKLKTLLHSTPTLSGEAGPPSRTVKDRYQALNIPKLKLPFSGGLSLLNLGSLFCFRIEPLYVLKIASLTVSILVFLAVVVLPWIELSGFGLGIFNVSGGIAAGCVVFLLAYASATFIIDRKLRSLVHITTAVVCLLLWMIFRFTLFEEISEFAISSRDNMGVGLILFVTTVILGIIIGIAEMFPTIDRQL